VFFCYNSIRKQRNEQKKKKGNYDVKFSFNCCTSSRRSPSLVRDWTSLKINNRLTRPRLRCKPNVDNEPHLLTHSLCTHQKNNNEISSIEKYLKKERLQTLYFLFESKVNDEIQILKCVRIVEITMGGLKNEWNTVGSTSLRMLEPTESESLSLLPNWILYELSSRWINEHLGACCALALFTGR
jgi:hypothetical protein